MWYAAKHGLQRADAGAYRCDNGKSDAVKRSMGFTSPCSASATSPKTPPHSEVTHLRQTKRQQKPSSQRRFVRAATSCAHETLLPNAAGERFTDGRRLCTIAAMISRRS